MLSPRPPLEQGGRYQYDDSIWAPPPTKADCEQANQLLDKFGDLFFSFDTNLNGTLERGEVAKLLRKYHAEVDGFARPLKVHRYPQRCGLHLRCSRKTLTLPRLSSL